MPSALSVLKHGLTLNISEIKSISWRKALLVFGLLALIGFISNRFGKDDSSSNTNETSNSEPSEKRTDCAFKQVEIKAFEVGTDKLLIEKLLEGCFTKELVEGGLGLVEIKNSPQTVNSKRGANKLQDQNSLFPPLMTTGSTLGNT